MEFRTRHARLAGAMEKARVDAMLVSHLPDVRYLCGFTGSNGVLVVVRQAGRTQARLFTDGRYAEQARLEVEGASVRIVKGGALAGAMSFVAGSPVERCGFDATHTTVQGLSAMRKVSRDEKVRNKRSGPLLKPLASLVSSLREVKSPLELEKMRAAAALGCELYEGMLGWIDTEMREVDVAAELEHRARRAGAEGMSFETIVASGVRSSMPHARATTAKLEAGTLLTLDFGIILEGYCSDMTRTVYLGHASETQSQSVREEQHKVFEAVLQAQQAAVAAVRAGVTCCSVDEAARSVLKKHNLAKYFSHSTGHGVGLEIHEGPRVAAGQTQTLEAGMVITVEPGAYLPAKFGVRIEDTVVVTQNGCEVLTPTHRGWIEL